MADATKIDVSAEVVAARVEWLRAWDSGDFRYEAAIIEALAAERDSLATKLAEAERVLAAYQERLFPTTVERDQARADLTAAQAAITQLREESEWRRRLLVWCRARLKLHAYQAVLDRTIESGPTPAPIGEPHVGSSTPPSEKSA